MNSNSIIDIASKFLNHTNKNIFLTGKAGTGKTTFLRNIVKNIHKRTVVAAPTGIAAINAGGVTLHSLFNLPFGAFIPEVVSFNHQQINQKYNNPYSLVRHMQFNSNKRKLLKELELLIVDEVSMLRADLLDAVDTVLRTVRKNQSPFGGVQVLFIGDLLQLPPVVKDDEWNILKSYYNSPFFFDARVLQKEKPLYIELEKIYRQQDDDFINLLNNLRNNEISESDVELLNKFYKPGFKAPNEENYIYITTHNNIADNINKQELEKIKEKEFVYKAETTGDFPEHMFPVDPELKLKKGSQVMFIKNDLSGEQKYFNGKIGVVDETGADSIVVSFNDQSDPVIVEKYEWKNVKYKLNEVSNEIEETEAGKFIHYPLKLAWAITIHKSQGLTFQKAIIDTERAFAPGQVYVALSRLTSLDGLILSSKVNFNSIRSERNVLTFSQSKNKETELQAILEDESINYIKEYLLVNYNLKPLSKKLKYHLDIYNEEEKKAKYLKFKPWAEDIKNNFVPHVETADKFLDQLQRILNNYHEQKDLILQRINAANKYFIPILTEFSQKILEHIKNIQKEKQLKQYTREVKELEQQFFNKINSLHKAEDLLCSLISKKDFDVVANNKDLINARTVIFETINKPTRKKVKGATQEETYNLFLSGKGINEIAKERQLAVTTIEGHLATYIKKGFLTASAFVPSHKLQIIKSVANETQVTRLSELKDLLEEDFSYSEIRFAIAEYEYEKEALTGVSY